MKKKKPTQRSPMAGQLSNPVNKPKVIPDKRDKLINNIESQELEYEFYS